MEQRYGGWAPSTTKAYTAAIDFAEQSGAVFCHAYDQIEVAAGRQTSSTRRSTMNPRSKR